MTRAEWVGLMAAILAASPGVEGELDEALDAALYLANEAEQRCKTGAQQPQEFDEDVLIVEAQKKGER